MLKNWVDIENLIISQPDNGEQALEIAENLFVLEQLI
jgi:RecA/RadA recombinase